MDRLFDSADEAPETPSPDDMKEARPPNWVDELVAMTRPGVEIRFPSRGLAGRVIPFQYEDFD